jgi:hypothetical protein
MSTCVIDLINNNLFPHHSYSKMKRSRPRRQQLRAQGSDIEFGGINCFRSVSYHAVVNSRLM